ncbi:ABC-type transport system substrate-binding protein [Paraburkholderia sp. GAS448]|uniref:ABC transporter substrate-binding protein n=1 Tax=Paraburkholderia sp. GAS448 TaxID=3035136 RepID=UPI003D1A3113
MKAIHFSLAGLVAVGAVSLLSGCDKTDSAQAAQSARVSKPVAGGALTWGVTTEPACFDPHRSSQQNAFWVIRNYIDSLISKKTDGTYAPWLAKSWSIADDGKSYTFNLRDDVHFTDGTPFNAAAVKANFDYILNNISTTSASASLLVHYTAATRAIGRGGVASRCDRQALFTAQQR